MSTERTRARPVSVLLVALVLATAAALPAEASVASNGRRARGTVHGTLNGSGSSTLDSVGSHPIWRSESSGTLDVTFLGGASYDLLVSFAGIVRFAALTITAPSGTLQLTAGPFIDSTLSTPMTVTVGTGRLALASGELRLGDYTKADVVCLPYPPAPAPDLFCNWNETATISGTLLMLLQPPPRYQMRT